LVPAPVLQTNWSKLGQYTSRDSSAHSDWRIEDSCVLVSHLYV